MFGGYALENLYLWGEDQLDAVERVKGSTFPFLRVPPSPVQIRPIDQKHQAKLERDMTDNPPMELTVTAVRDRGRPAFPAWFTWGRVVGVRRVGRRLHCTLVVPWDTHCWVHVW